MTNIDHSVPITTQLSHRSFWRLKNQLLRFLTQHCPRGDTAARRWFLQQIAHSGDPGQHYRELMISSNLQRHRRPAAHQAIRKFAAELLEHLEGDRSQGGAA